MAVAVTIAAFAIYSDDRGELGLFFVTHVD
jgi:hypothetical protein